jgi:hypothetical protein
MDVAGDRRTLAEEAHRLDAYIGDRLLCGHVSAEHAHGTGDSDDGSEYVHGLPLSL